MTCDLEAAERVMEILRDQDLATKQHVVREIMRSLTSHERTVWIEQQQSELQGLRRLARRQGGGSL